MTTRAFDISMRANQCMSGVDVVIKRELRPLVGDVARLATLPKVRVMIVIVLVTRNTGCTQLIGERVITVAVTACQCGMLTR